MQLTRAGISEAELGPAQPHSDHFANSLGTDTLSKVQRVNNLNLFMGVLCVVDRHKNWRVNQQCEVKLVKGKTK